MKMIKQMWYIFENKQKMKAIQLLVLILIGTIFETLGVTAIVPFISAVIYADSLLEKQIVKYIFELLNLKTVEELIILLAIMLIVIYIIKNLYLVWVYRVQFHFVFDNQRKLSNKLLSCYMHQPYEFHLQHNSSELLQNIFNDVDTFYLTVMYLITVVTDACVCIALGVLLFFTDKSITLGVMVLLGIFILTFYRWYKKENNRLGVQRRIYSQKSIQSIQQALGGIKEIKVLGQEEYFRRAYDSSYFLMLEAKRKVNTYSMMPKPLMEAMCVMALMIVVAIKIVRGVDVEYFIPTLSVFALAVIRILPSSSRLTSNVSNVIYGKPTVEVIYNDIKNVEALMEEYEKKKCINDEEMVFEKEIEVKDLVFYYENNERCILDSVNLLIPRNSSIALVGPSGSGKTTLADTILGVLEYQSGKILVDGVDIQSNLSGWREKLGYIPQNIYITDDTIRRNIAFAIDDDKIDDKRVWKALEEAHLHTFVRELEHGLDTIIGEQGARISGGQRQRIGIARALYHNPDVLVLDEATSALDNDTEQAIMESIDALSGKKTLIIIAHRLSTIKNCDYVYTVENGKVTLQKK